MGKLYYAGIGSRQTPDEILFQMELIALLLYSRNYVLRSGGAKGADSAFAKGTKSRHIYYASDATDDSIALSSKYHPAWNRCSDYVKQLHGRNSMIILGVKLDTPVEFVVCWTPTGEATGGTGLGIRIARAYNIPVYNLKSDIETDELRAHCRTIPLPQ